MPIPRALCLILTIGVSACSGKVDAGPVSAEEYRVYSAVLETLFPDAHAQAVQDSTLKLPEIRNKDEGLDYAQAVSNLEGSSRTLTRRFVQRNATSAPLVADSFPTHVPILVIPEAELQALFAEGRNDGWERFYERYPFTRGFLTFSRVAFNNDTTLSVLNVDYHCGWLCGGGTTLLLSKKDGRWIVASQAPWWIS